MEQKQVVGVQLSVQAFNAAIAVLQKLPFEAVADTMTLMRQYTIVYAPENPIDSVGGEPVSFKLPDVKPKAEIHDEDR